MTARTEDFAIFDEKPKRAIKTRRNNKEEQAVAFATKLGAAKHALAQAEELPEVTNLMDHADAVRAAARSLHVSAAGINAWTRFVIDAERKAWERIEAMRNAGILATQKSHSGSKKRPELTLADLIERSPTQRASQWSMLAKLTEHQLNEAERIANEEDRLLTRGELMKLAKAGMPAPSRTREPPARPADEAALIGRAQTIAEMDGFIGDSVTISDDAKINKTERGAWIEAWVWIEDELAQSDLDETAAEEEEAAA